MNRQEHLLTIAMEECNEVAQRISKANRFGMLQIQEDADDAPEENPDRLSNRDRIILEFADLCAVMSMLDLVPDGWAEDVHPDRVRAKWAKVERYMTRSLKCGTLSTLPPEAP